MTIKQVLLGTPLWAWKYTYYWYISLKLVISRNLYPQRLGWERIMKSTKKTSPWTYGFLWLFWRLWEVVRACLGRIHLFSSLRCALDYVVIETAKLKLESIFLPMFRPTCVGVVVRLGCSAVILITNWLEIVTILGCRMWPILWSWELRLCYTLWMFDGKDFNLIRFWVPKWFYSCCD